MWYIYVHSIIDHVPLIERIACLHSINAEQAERCFDLIVDITNKTWNKQIQDLATNTMACCLTTYCNLCGSDLVSSLPCQHTDEIIMVDKISESEGGLKLNLSC
jgi:hypothetical protein